MLDKESKLNYCRSTCGLCCKSHFYNGHNPIGIKVCTDLVGAELVCRDMYSSIDETSPIRDVSTLSCFKPEYDVRAKWMVDAGIAKASTIVIDLVDVSFPRVRVNTEHDLEGRETVSIILSGVTLTRFGADDSSSISHNEVVQVDVTRFLAAVLAVQLHKLEK